MSYTKSGGRTKIIPPSHGEKRQRVRVPRLHPQPDSGFPRISREAIEKLLAKGKEGPAETTVTLSCPEVPEIDPRVRQIYDELMYGEEEKP